MPYHSELFQAVLSSVPCLARQTFAWRVIKTQTRTLRLRRSRITPCSTLGFLCFARIAPLSASSALCWPPILLGVHHLAPCAVGRLLCFRRLVPVLVRGSPRVTDCSVFSTWNSASPTNCSVHDAWRSPSFSDCSLLDASRSHAARGLLRARRLTLRAGLRIAPYADTLRPWIDSRIAPCSTLSSAPPQITLCPMLDAFFRLRIAPPSSLCVPVLAADCSVPNTLSFALNPDFSVSYTYRSAPNMNYSMFDTWLFIPLTDCSALFT